MKKIIFLILSIIIITNPIFGQTISELNFFDIDQSNWIIQKDQNVCKDYYFEKLAETKDSTFVLNLKLENYIVPKKDVSVDVYLNDLKEGTLKEEEIKVNNIFRLYNLKENNKLTICVENKYLPKMIISKKSTIGNYLLPEFKEENFYQIIGEYELTQTMIPVEVHIKNTGAKETNIEIYNATEKYLENSLLETVSGHANYSGPIGPGEEKIIKYYIKTLENTEYMTPRAILKYTDEFGIEREIYTETKIITILKNDQKLDALIDIENRVLLNEKTYGKIVIRNISETDLKNIVIEPEFTENITIGKKNISLLNKFDVIEIPFTISKEDQTKTSLSFSIKYNTLDNSTLEFKTKTITLLPVEKTNYTNEVIGILLLFCVLIYIWIVKL